MTIDASRVMDVIARWTPEERRVVAVLLTAAYGHGFNRGADRVGRPMSVSVVDLLEGSLDDHETGADLLNAVYEGAIQPERS